MVLEKGNCCLWFYNCISLIEIFTDKIGKLKIKLRCSRACIYVDATEHPLRKQGTDYALGSFCANEGGG